MPRGNPKGHHMGHLGDCLVVCFWNNVGGRLKSMLGGYPPIYPGSTPDLILDFYLKVKAGVKTDWGRQEQPQKREEQPYTRRNSPFTALAPLRKNQNSSRGCPRPMSNKCRSREVRSPGVPRGSPGYPRGTPGLSLGVPGGDPRSL